MPRSPCNSLGRVTVLQHPLPMTTGHWKLAGPSLHPRAVQGDPWTPGGKNMALKNTINITYKNIA